MKETKTILDWAKFYLSKGFPVIPIKPNDKKPAIDTWKIFQQHKPTENRLKVWFGNGSKNNIAIITGGISGLAVIDFDSNKGVQYAQDNNFPSTPMVKTGKEEGYHAYCKYKKGVRNFQKRDDLPGIDLRGEGGYVVAPPSIHPSGQQYKWVEGKGLDDLPLAELPEIILVQKPEDKTPLKELYRGVPEGKRNDSLTRLVGSWVNDGLSFEECLEMAYQINEKNDPPETDLKRIEATVRSIYEKHQRELSTCPPIYNQDNKDNSDYTEKSSSYELDLSKALRTGEELQKLDIHITWAVENLIPRESITLISGRGGIGKTWLAIQLADSVSKGETFLGLEAIQMPVVYVDFENSLPVLVERVRKIKAGKVNFWHTTNEIRPPRLDTPDWELYKKLPPGALLIFDTLRGSQGRDENDSQHMALIMGILKQFRDKGYTIILLHHTPKSNDRIYKGSTAILDLSDHVLSLHKVRKGNYEEIEDDDSEDTCYKFGTKDKTRYEPFHLHIEFNPEKGFQIAPNPDTETFEAIYQLLEEKSPLNQSQLYEFAKNELGIKSKGKVFKILKKGTDKYWSAEKEGRSVYYSVLSTCPDIYSKDNRTDQSELSNPTETDTPNDTLQSLDNSHLSTCPKGDRTDRTGEALEVFEVLE